jgi:hypothetical protein
MLHEGPKVRLLKNLQGLMSAPRPHRANFVFTMVCISIPCQAYTYISTRVYIPNYIYIANAMVLIYPTYPLLGEVFLLV